MTKEKKNHFIRVFFWWHFWTTSPSSWALVTFLEWHHFLRPKSFDNVSIRGWSWERLQMGGLLVLFVLSSSTPWSFFVSFFSSKKKKQTHTYQIWNNDQTNTFQCSTRSHTDVFKFTCTLFFLNKKAINQQKKRETRGKQSLTRKMPFLSQTNPIVEFVTHTNPE